MRVSTLLNDSLIMLIRNVDASWKCLNKRNYYCVAVRGVYNVYVSLCLCVTPVRSVGRGGREHRHTRLFMCDTGPYMLDARAVNADTPDC